MLTSISGAVAGDTKPGSDAKKYQQAFLAPLPGTQNLVATLRNVNKHFWRRCRG